MTEDQEQRLVALESKLAHQDGAIEELSQLAYRQGETIDQLKKDVGRLRQQLQKMLFPPDPR